MCDMNLLLCISTNRRLFAHLSALLSVLLSLLHSDQLGPVHSDEGRHLPAVRGALVKLLAQLKENRFKMCDLN